MVNIMASMLNLYILVVEVKRTLTSRNLKTALFEPGGISKGTKFGRN
jgi:hypothetical protein